MFSFRHGCLLLLIACYGQAGLLHAQTTAQDVRTAHAATQAAFRTFRCRVDASLEFKRQGAADDRPDDRNQKLVVSYARSGSKERLSETGGALGKAEAVRDTATGNGQMLIPGNQKTIGSGILGASHTLPTLARPWVWAGMQLADVGRGLHEVMETATVTRLETRKEGALSLVYLDLKYDQEKRFEVWVDPATNHQIRRVVAHRTLGKITTKEEFEISDFKELTPGVYFPQVCKATLFINGSLIRKTTASFSDMRLNERLGDQTFTIAFPPETRVVDEHKNVSYTVGTDGRAGKSVTLPQESPRPEPKPETVITGKGTPPDEQPIAWPWHRIALYLSLVAVVIGGALVYRKRSVAESD